MDSNDPDGTIVSYQWDFGDGQSGKGSQLSHSYTSEGTYTVVLTVVDEDGLRDTTERSVTVKPIDKDGLRDTTERSVTVKPIDPIGFKTESPIFIVLGIIGAAVAGGMGFFVYKKKSSGVTGVSTQEPPMPPTSTDIEKGRKCNVCGTNIPEGVNVCPSCGDTYS